MARGCSVSRGGHFAFLVMSPGLIRLKKDSSQETVISLMGMLVGKSRLDWFPIMRLIREQVGTLVVSHISSRLMTWISLVFLLLVHIMTNYAAVRAVKMTTLNRQRSNIVFSTLLDETRASSPGQASKDERVFERDGVLRWKASSESLGFCRIGVSLDELLRLSSPSLSRSTRSLRNVGVSIPRLLDIFEREDYVLWFDKGSKRGAIVLKSGATPVSQLKAWSHALMVSRYVAHPEQGIRSDQKQHEKASDSITSVYALLEETLKSHSKEFPGFVKQLKDAGWDVETPALETRPGRRLAVAKSS